VTVTDDVFGSHSFHALHLAADGTIYVSWLGQGGGSADAPPAAPAGHHHGAPAAGGHDGHGSSAAWISSSTDGGATWRPAVRVDLGEACPCCRTALATAPNGTLYMAWRHVYEGNVRDVVLSRSTDRGVTWSEPVRVHADDWVFEACPHAGPALQVDSASALHVVWWTGKAGAAGVFYARSTDEGRTFATPVALETGAASRPAHVQLALGADGTVVAAWDLGTTQVPRVVVRVSRDGGRRFGEQQPVSSEGAVATFPVVGVAGSTLAVAWSEQTREAAQRAADAAPNMKDPKAVMPLAAVGEAQVFVRRAILR
jgi:hypothetical protein